MPDREIQDPDIPQAESGGATPGDTGKPATEPPRADVGVLLVHGIGDHKEGETLLSFGEPLIDWIKEWLRYVPSGSIRVDNARLRATRTEAISPAFAEVEIGRGGQSERWVFTEAWWGDTVQPPQTVRLLGWLLARGPLLVYWHFYLGPLREASRTSLPYAVVACLIAGLIQLVVLVALVLSLVPFGPWRQFILNVVRTLTLTLGDSFVLLEQDFQSAALVRRVENALAWLSDRAKKIIVVAHSQGGAIAHEALRRMRTDRIASFISIGSGLEKLQFLQHVRRERAGLVAAVLIAPLMVIGLPLAIAGTFGGVEARWQAAIGAICLFSGLVAVAQVAGAFTRYRRELTKKLEELDLRKPLTGAEWHDLYASHDLVPMGKDSLLEGAEFVTRYEIRNQRSYLNDHTAYFGNRLGFLPALWWLLARHSRIPSLLGNTKPRIDWMMRIHNLQSIVLWLSAAADLAAIAIFAIAVRAFLPDFGGSIASALSGIGMSYLVKPFDFVGAALSGIASEAGLGNLDAKSMATALVAVVTLIAGMIAWRAVFHSAWLLRSAADWRKACRVELTFPAQRLRPQDIANLCIWAGFGLAPLAVAILVAFAPEELSVQFLGRAIAATMAFLCAGVSAFYAVLCPYVSGATTTAEVKEIGWVRHLLLPASMLITVGVFLFCARWFWPSAWGDTTMDVMEIVVWAAMALAWMFFLATRGFGLYGRLTAILLLVCPWIAVFTISMHLAPDADLSRRLMHFDVACMVLVALANVWQERNELWQQVRDTSWGRRLFGPNPQAIVEAPPASQAATSDPG